MMSAPAGIQGCQWYTIHGISNLFLFKLGGVYLALVASINWMPAAKLHVVHWFHGGSQHKAQSIRLQLNQTRNKLPMLRLAMPAAPWRNLWWGEETLGGAGVQGLACFQWLQSFARTHMLHNLYPRTIHAHYGGLLDHQP